MSRDGFDPLSSDEPIDPDAVRKDDELIDLLADGGVPASAVEDELIDLLVALHETAQPDDGDER